MMTWFYTLAQTAPTTTQPGPVGPLDFLRSPMVPLILVLIVFWWMMSRGRGKERRRYEQMLGALKKNDRVQTIGGVIGTVVDVARQRRRAQSRRGQQHEDPLQPYGDQGSPPRRGGDRREEVGVNRRAPLAGVPARTACSSGSMARRGTIARAINWALRQ